MLAELSYNEADHHFGRPFLTAYQLAILFKERYPAGNYTTWKVGFCQTDNYSKLISTTREAPSPPL